MVPEVYLRIKKKFLETDYCKGKPLGYFPGFILPSLPKTEIFYFPHPELRKEVPTSPLGRGEAETPRQSRREICKTKK